MTHTETPVTNGKHSRAGGSVLSYTIGFILSLVLTLAAYAIVTGKSLDGWPLLYGLTGLALVQLVVQLVFFLHLRHEDEPRWKLLVFDLMLLIVAILLFGSIWIMNNLNYRGHSLPQEGTDQYIITDEGFSP